MYDGATFTGANLWTGAAVLGEAVEDLVAPLACAGEHDAGPVDADAAGRPRPEGLRPAELELAERAAATFGS